MRLRTAGVAAVAWCLVTSGVAAQRQFQIYASVVDATGQPPTSLQPADIRVLENGAEARILTIDSVSFPVKLQLLVDNGIGLGSDNMLPLRNGVRGLIDALPPDVEVTVVATAPQPRFLVRATRDRAAIAKGLDLLSPDGSAGRFVESLNEATQRIERDKSDYAPVIVSFATTAGDRNVRDSDVEQMSKRLQARPTTVHVVLLSLMGTRSASGGGNQIEIGTSVAQMTRGRFESIAAPSRLATLLPEIGAQVAKVHQSQSRQFKITVQRPEGATGEPSNVTMGARGDLAVTAVSFDGRISNP